MCIYFIFVSFFFFKQKTAYEMRISDWSSDVCSSDLPYADVVKHAFFPALLTYGSLFYIVDIEAMKMGLKGLPVRQMRPATMTLLRTVMGIAGRSEEHTSELQSLMRISYAVFCLKKKKQNQTEQQISTRTKYRSNEIHTTRNQK